MRIERCGQARQWMPGLPERSSRVESASRRYESADMKVSAESNSSQNRLAQYARIDDRLGYIIVYTVGDYDADCQIIP
jgi:hypothetical protein